MCPLGILCVPILTILITEYDLFLKTILGIINCMHTVTQYNSIFIFMYPIMLNLIEVVYIYGSNTVITKVRHKCIKCITMKWNIEVCLITFFVSMTLTHLFYDNFRVYAIFECNQIIAARNHGVLLHKLVFVLLR